MRFPHCVHRVCVITQTCCAAQNKWDARSPLSRIVYESACRLLYGYIVSEHWIHRAALTTESLLSLFYHTYQFTSNVF